MPLSRKPLNLQPVSDLHVRRVFTDLDTALQDVYGVLNQVIETDPGTSRVRLAAGIRPRQVPADPTKNFTFGVVHEIVVDESTGVLYQKAGKTGTDKNWVFAGSTVSGGGGGLAGTPGVPVDINLQANHVGFNSAQYSLADHRHHLDEDITPIWTSPHLWQMGVSTETPIKVRLAAAQSVDAILVTNSADTPIALVDSVGSIAVNRATASGRVTVKSSGASESDVAALTPVLWLDASDPLNNGGDVSSLTNGGDLAAWSNKGTVGGNFPRSTDTAGPFWFNGTGSGRFPASLANLKPCVGTVPDSGGNPRFDPLTAGNQSFGTAFTCFVVARLDVGNDIDGTLNWLGGNTAVGGPTTAIVGRKVFGADRYMESQSEDPPGGGTTRSQMARTVKNGSGVDLLGALTWHAYAHNRNGSVDATSYRMYVNNVEATTVFSSENLTSPDGTVFARVMSVKSLDVLTAYGGWISEVLVFTGSMSAANALTVWTYLDQKYALGMGLSSSGGGLDLNHWRDAVDGLRGRVTPGIRLGLSDVATDLATIPVARLHVIDAVEPLRLGFSQTQYFKTVVSPTGAVTLDAVGSSPSFSYNDTVLIRTDTTPQLDVGKADASSRITLSVTTAAGTFGSTVPNAAAASSFTFQPTVAQTAGTDRYYYNFLDQAGGIMLRGHSDGSWSFNSATAGGYITVAGNVTQSAGINFAPTFTGTATFTVATGKQGQAGGLFQYQQGSTSTSLYDVGGYFKCQIPGSHTATLSEAYGGYFVSLKSNNSTSTVIGRMGGWRVSDQTSSGKGAVTNWEGGYVENPSVSLPSATLVRGLIIEEMTRGAASERVGIKLEAATVGYKALVVRSNNSYATSDAEGEWTMFGSVRVRHRSPQTRLEFDTSNYLNIDVSSAGLVTLDASGSGARFLFNDFVTVGTPSFTDVPLAVGGTAIANRQISRFDDTQVDTAAGPYSGVFSGLTLTRTINGTTTIHSLYNLGATVTVSSGVTESGSLIGYRGNYLRSSASDLGTVGAITMGSWGYGHNTGIGSSAVTSTCIGLHLKPFLAAGTISSFVDLYIAQLQVSGGTATSRYAVFQEDTSTRNYFGSSVAIGPTDPLAKLHVRSTTAPQFRVDYDASNFMTVSIESDGDAVFSLNASTDIFEWQRDFRTDSSSLSWTFIGNRGNVVGLPVGMTWQQANVNVSAHTQWTDNAGSQILRLNMAGGLYLAGGGDLQMESTGAVLLSSGGINFPDGASAAFGTITGTKLGGSVLQKLGFWNKAPVVQPAATNQAALTNSTTGTYDGTLVDVGVVPTQANINNNFTDIHELLNEIRTALVNTGIIKGAA